MDEKKSEKNAETKDISIVDLRAVEEARKDIEQHAKAVAAAKRRIVHDHEDLIEQVRTVGNSFEDMVKSIQSNTGIRQLLREVEGHQTLMRMVQGPLWELRQAGVLDPLSPVRKEFQKTQNLLANYQERFRLPEVAETARLLSGMKLNPLLEGFKRQDEQMAVLRQRLESIRVPWLDADNALRSATAAAQIQGIGEVMARLPVYDDQTSSALRVGLGDWQDRITWPKKIFVNLEARSKFYFERGYDPSLADFPASAFQETIRIAGLRGAPPPLVEVYGLPILPEDDEEEEEALQRTNAAHDVLMRLETIIRRFIDDKMTMSHGPNWIKHRLPKDVRENWETKKRKAESKGAKCRPLIAYADFTDYEKVLCRGDNWGEIFATFFKRPENVRETFQRLYPLRLDTMHARPITQEDELFLYVETRRLMKVILSCEE